VGGMHTEEPETQPSGTTPFTMWISPAVLLAAVFILPLVFHLGASAEAQADRVLDTASGAAYVLEGKPLPPLQVHPESVSREALFRALIFCGLALGLAAATLGRRHLPRAVRRLGGALARALEALRKLHTGDVGDDIAWLAFGVAALGVSCIALLT
jgi:multicomponent Na+:H+ antiporter subunit D